jgi:predicted MPP superfamily phosphohydrolase/energy-coupling factor transporter ATP-binding protein EcfA2
MEITILHLSDLHYSESKKKDIDIVIEALLQDVNNLKTSKNLNIDFIIFSGDFVQAGSSYNDFELAENKIIIPLLKSLNKDYDDFLIVPGNHDIDINEIDNFLEIGLENALKDNKIINDLIDNIEKHENVFYRLKNFYKFRKKLGSKNIKFSNNLFSIYKIEKNKKKIGVALFNSSWRATGKPNNYDYGKLLLGERQIDNALDELKDADLKIASMHHPFEWMNEIERNKIKIRTLSEFNFLFVGHNHFSEQMNVESSDGSIFINNGGCLYNSRDYNNGYSILKYDFENNKCHIYYRTYNDRQRKFIKGEDVYENGEKEFFLDQKAKIKNKINFINTIDSLNKIILEHSNKLLLPSFTDSAAPKNLKEIFVDPPLYTQSEDTNNAEETTSKKAIQIKDIISSPEKIIFLIGKKESGKTTLLNYIGLEIIEKNSSSNLKVPFYINYKDLPKGVNPMEKAMKNFVYIMDNKLDIEFLLKNGKCVILIDDLIYLKNKKFDTILNFIKKYPENKYIFVINEDIYFSLGVEAQTDFPFSPDKIYIHSFKRKQTRSLIKKWFNNGLTKVEDILERIMQHLSDINIPSSPVIISLILWIFEKQENFVPINKSSLLEKFIDIILEKLNIEESKYNAFDFRNKEHYLGYLTEIMVKEEKYIFSRLELEKITIKYFDDKGLNTSITELINFFLNKGIFLEINGNIEFKFRCFFEFFLAKRMIENEDFYKYILEENRYLAFSSEIDYLTGLQRNNIDILNLISERLAKNYNNLKMDIDLRLFNNINLNQSVLEEKEKEKLIREIKDNRMNDEKKDNIFDKKNNLAKNQNIEKSSPTEPAFKYILSLILYSKIIKNCEFLDKSIKTQNLNNCLTHWGKMTTFFLIAFEDLIKEIRNKDNSLKDDKMDDFCKTIIPLVIQAFIHENLGSEKLETLLLEETQNKKNEKIISMMSILLYSDLKLPGYISNLRKFVNQVKGNKLILEIIFFKLYYYYMVRDISDAQKRSIEDLIASIYYIMNSSELKIKEKVFKGKFIKNLKDRYLRRPQLFNKE